MFDDLNLLRRIVKDLAGFRYVGLAQRVTAGITGCRQRMNDDLIRFGDAFQRGAFVTFLPTFWVLSHVTQGFRCGLAQTVRGRRLAGIVAVFGQTDFKCGYP